MTVEAIQRIRRGVDKDVTSYFEWGTDVLTNGLTLEDVAKGIDRSRAMFCPVRVHPSKDSHRCPPANRRRTVAKPPRNRARELAWFAENLASAEHA